MHGDDPVDVHLTGDAILALTADFAVVCGVDRLAWDGDCIEAGTESLTLDFIVEYGEDLLGDCIETGIESFTLVSIVDCTLDFCGDFIGTGTGSLVLDFSVECAVGFPGDERFIRGPNTTRSHESLFPSDEVGDGGNNRTESSRGVNTDGLVGS